MTTTEPRSVHSPAPAQRGDRAWKITAGIVSCLLVGFIAYVATRPTHPRPATFPASAPTVLALGSQAPGFILPRLGGGSDVSLASTRGTPTIVNFFASWCRDCQSELSAFGSLSSATSGEVSIIGVDSNDTDGTEAQALLARAGATYPVGVDSDAKVATAYRLVALPVTYFLNAHGRVVHVGFGSQSLATLQHWASVLRAPRASS